MNTQEIRDGSWNLRGLKFNIPKKLHHWAVVNFAPDKLGPVMINNKLNALRQCCEKLGEFVFSSQQVQVTEWINVGIGTTKHQKCR